MIRVSLVVLYVSVLCVYAWRDWFKALCGLILLVGVIEHPDMPKNILGIQGLNLWNVLLLVVVSSWLVHRAHENLRWDMPNRMAAVLSIYFAFVVVAFVRMIMDLDGMREWASLGLGEAPSIAGLFSEDFVNCFKWVVPGILLYDGARDDRRLRLALFAILGVYVLLALQVIRWMPLSNLSSGADLEERSAKILSNEVGFHRVNLSMMLAGASWALLAARLAVQSRFVAFGIGGLAFIAMLGQALTGGRAGYVTWGCVGLCVAWLKWRRYFIYGPILILIVAATVPAARERFMQGFTEDTVDTNALLEETMPVGTTEGPDLYTVTAGRVVAWPYVIEKIAESPLIGYGREAMIRTGISTRLSLEFQEAFPHPHNMYLEWTLDNGIIALLIVVGFYLVIVRKSAAVFRYSKNPVHAAVGGAALSLTLALLLAGIGSQSFYPREGAVGMWCAIGLLLRVYQMKATASVPAQEPAAAVKRPWRTPVLQPTLDTPGSWRKPVGGAR